MSAVPVGAPRDGHHTVRIDAFAAENVDIAKAEVILADAADQRYIRPQARSRNGLIAAFAAGIGGEARAFDCFARQMETGNRNGHIDVDAAHDEDFFHADPTCFLLVLSVIIAQREL